MSEVRKICTKCGEEKCLSEFNKQKTGKYGVQSKCRSCQKEYRKENSEKLREYYIKNRDKIIARSTERNMGESVKEYRKEYYSRPDIIEKVKSRNSSKKYRDRAKEYKKEYYSRPDVINRERVRKSSQEYRCKKSEYDKKPENRVKKAEREIKYREARKENRVNTLISLGFDVDSRVEYGLFYVIELGNGLQKFGITMSDFNKRYSSKDRDNFIDVKIMALNESHTYALEKIVKMETVENSYSGKSPFVGGTGITEIRVDANLWKIANEICNRENFKFQII
jgi:uncharacterized low-complexity protein